MKTLEIEFTSGEGGFSTTPLTYKQIVRNQDFAIYERTLNGKIRDYELIKIKVQLKGHQIFQKIVDEDTEVYPSSSQWGHFGWTYNDKSIAMSEFKIRCNPPTQSQPLKPQAEEIKVKGKRGRPKMYNRTQVVLPQGFDFTMADLLIKNSEYTQPSMYQEVKKMLELNVIKVVGTVKREGMRGKPALMYKKV